MSEHNAYWFRYVADEKISYVAVVAENLEKAFEMVQEKYKIENGMTTYLNRELNVLLPF